MGDETAEPMPDAKPHIVEFDPDAPASVFTREQIDYVNSIAEYLSPSQVEGVRRLEHLIFNRNVNACAWFFVPGLRGDTNFDGTDEGIVYVKRFSSARYAKMMDLFLDHEPSDFPKEGSGGNMPGYRVTLPNGDRFYPIAFFGDLVAWRKRLRESADLHGTELAHFDRGTFVVSDGQRFAFADLRIEALETRRTPSSW